MSTANSMNIDNVATPSSSPSTNRSSSSQPRSSRHSIPTNKEDALHLASGNVNQLSKARSHLVSKGYLTQGDTISFFGLSLILFQIVADSKVPLLADNIKSVAFLLETLEVDSISDQIANSVNVKIKGTLDSLVSSAANLESCDEELGLSVSVISNVALQLAETTNESSSSINDTAGRLQNQIAKQLSSPVMAPQENPGINPIPLTYAAATAQPHIPPSHTNAIVRHEVRLHQIIIQPAPDSVDNFRPLSELELVSKATLAFEAIEKGEHNAPKDLQFVSAKKLAAGSIILDLNSVEAAVWLKRVDVCPLFMQQFSATSVFKEHEFRVLAEFVPVSFAQDVLAALVCIEKDSGVKPGALVRVKWAKLPEKRHALQRTAHLKLFFNSPEAANFTIHNGLYIAGKKVVVDKM